MFNLIIIFIFIFILYILSYSLVLYLQVYIISVFINRIDLLINISIVTKFNFYSFNLFLNLITILFLILIVIILLHQIYIKYNSNNIEKKYLPALNNKSKLYLYIKNPIFNINLEVGVSQRKTRVKKPRILSKIKDINITLKDYICINLIVISSSICIEDFLFICSTNPNLRIKDQSEVVGKKIISAHTPSRKDNWFIDEKYRVFISFYKSTLFQIYQNSLLGPSPKKGEESFLFHSFLLHYSKWIEKTLDSPFICLTDANYFLEVNKVYFNTLLFHSQIIGKTVDRSVEGDASRFTIQDILLEIKGSDLRFYTNLNYNTYMNSIDRARTLKYYIDLKELRECSKNILVFFYIIKRKEVKDLLTFLEDFNFDVYNSNLIDFNSYTLLVLDNINIIISSNGGLKSPEHFNSLLNSFLKLLPRKTSKSLNKISNFKEICTFENKILDYSKLIVVKDVNILNRTWDSKKIAPTPIYISSKAFFNLNINSKVSIFDFINTYNDIPLIEIKLLSYQYYFISCFGSSLFKFSVKLIQSLEIESLTNNPVNIDLMLNHYEFFFDFLNSISKEKQKSLTLGVKVDNSLNKKEDSFIIKYFEFNIANGSIKTNITTNREEIYTEIVKISAFLNKIGEYSKYSGVYILDYSDKLLILNNLEESVFILVQYYIFLFGVDSFLILLKDLNKSFYLPLSDSLEDKISFFKRFSKFLIFIIFNKDNN